MFVKYLPKIVIAVDCVINIPGEIVQNLRSQACVTIVYFEISPSLLSLIGCYRCHRAPYTQILSTFSLARIPIDIANCICE